MDNMELVLDVESAEEYTQDFADSLEEALFVKLGQLNEQTADLIRANLSGEVLNVKSGILLGTVLARGPFHTSEVIDALVTAGGDEAPYGIVHEEGGAGYYIIMPVNRMALMFEMNGKNVFAMRVNHPPAVARHWFSGATDQMEPIIAEGLQETISEVTGE